MTFISFKKGGFFGIRQWKMYWPLKINRGRQKKSYSSSLQNTKQAFGP